MPNSSTILLVDDEESIQTLLTYPLERDGYAVVQARDGEEALRRFDEEAIDLVDPRRDAAATRRPRGVQAPSQPRATSRSSCSPPAARSSTRCSGSSSARTTTSRSRSRSASSAAASARSCDARRRRTSPASARSSSSAASSGSTCRGERCEVRGETVQLTFIEFEMLVVLASEPRRRVLAPRAARAPSWGRRLPRAADDRRARSAPAREDRARSERSRS